MKKTIAILLLLCLCITLFSCQDEISENESSGYVCTNNITTMIQSFEEYQEIIKRDKLPDGFVYYEDIKQFGEFDKLRIDAPSLDTDVPGYIYWLIDSTGATIDLSIKVDPEHQKTPKEHIFSSKWERIKEMDSNDLRKVTTEEVARYIHGDIVYMYDFSKTMTISWSSKGVFYRLGVEDYPETEDPFISKLLNTDTAVETLSSVFELDDIDTWEIKPSICDVIKNFFKDLFE